MAIYLGSNTVSVLKYHVNTVCREPVCNWFYTSYS